MNADSMNAGLHDVTALIADDEAPMRDQLRARLAAVWPQLRIVAEATNGLEAVELAARHAPHIAFLDIRMPGLSGIEAARRLAGRTQVVFATAYDQYALDAFEQGALDYLLKPVTAERLAATCARVRARLDAPARTDGDIAARLAQVAALLESRQPHAAPDKPAPAYLRWIQAQVGASLRMISTREVLFFRADEKYTCVQTANAEFLIRKPLKDLLDELDPDEFWRIHRSTVVRVDAIRDVVRDLRGRSLVRLRDHPAELEVSRNHAHLFQQM